MYTDKSNLVWLGLAALQGCLDEDTLRRTVRRGQTT